MLSRENIILAAIVVCVISTLYLFKEVRQMKNTPPQMVRVPYPVQLPQQQVEAREPKKIEVVEETEEE